MDLIPVSVIDDFFDDPDYIRSQALSLTFENKYNAPGSRAICPSPLADDISKKIIAVLLDPTKCVTEYAIDLYFQITTDRLEEGWVHTDAGGQTYFAGVVYLTPNAPSNAGTSIYRLKDKDLDLNILSDIQQIKNDVYFNRSNDLETFRKKREENNSFFNKTIDVANVYNRLLIYPANEFHSENRLFGTTKEDARLTLVFFVRHIASSGLLPLDRLKLIKV